MRPLLEAMRQESDREYARFHYVKILCDRDSVVVKRGIGSLAEKEHFLSQNPIKANRPPNPSLPILPAGSSSYRFFQCFIPLRRH
jgi:hypothetical protein